MVQQLDSLAPLVMSAFSDILETLFAVPSSAGLPADEPPGEVLVSWGLPPSPPRDFISLMDVRSDQAPATMSPLRQRDETLEVILVISCQRGGKDPGTQRFTFNRAFGLLGELENYVRVTDTTLGLLGIRECFLIAHQAAAATSEAVLKFGRCTDVRATFRAIGRISS